MEQEGDGGWKPITLFPCKQWERLFSGPWPNSQAIKATASAFPCHAHCNEKWQLMKAFLHGLLTLLFCVGTCQGEVSLNTENSKPGECFTVIGMSWGVANIMPPFFQGSWNDWVSNWLKRDNGGLYIPSTKIVYVLCECADLSSAANPTSQSPQYLVCITLKIIHWKFVCHGGFEVVNISHMSLALTYFPQHFAQLVAWNSNLSLNRVQWAI